MNTINTVEMNAALLPPPKMRYQAMGPAGLNDLVVDLRQCGHVRLEADFFSTDFKEMNECNVVFSGTCKLDWKGKRHDLKPGHLYLFRVALDRGDLFVSKAALLESLAPFQAAIGKSFRKKRPPTKNTNLFFNSSNPASRKSSPTRISPQEKSPRTSASPTRFIFSASLKKCPA